MKLITQFLSLTVLSASVIQAGDGGKKLSHRTLTRALKLGRIFFLNNQTGNGSFRYEYDSRTGRGGDGDNSVRQAGALWGLASVHAEMPGKDTDAALRHGFRFFMKQTKTMPSGAKLVIYPGEREGRTGTVALLSLALTDYLRTNPTLPEKELALYKRYLNGYVAFLLSLRTSKGSFKSSYSRDGRGIDPPSPYFDGEVLLLLTRVAKYMNRADLKAKIAVSAETMYQTHAVDALKLDPDSPQTKGFYQWGTMAFYEIFTAKWGGDSSKYGKRILKLAEWMINTHRVLKKGRNTAYAYEGLIHAFDVARKLQNRNAMHFIGNTVDTGLYKLCTWQVGSRLANTYIQSQPRLVGQARGGVLNSANEPTLRIDVTQHQMHAVILARKYMYKKP